MHRDKCVAYAKAHRHPEGADRAIWEVFADERQKRGPLRGRFAGFPAVRASVSKTCLVRFASNKYGEGERGRASGRNPGLADRIVMRPDGIAAGEHPRSLGVQVWI